MKKLVYIVLFFWGYLFVGPGTGPSALMAQIPQQGFDDPALDIEDILIGDAEGDIDFQMTTQFEHLEFYLRRPLDLNAADYEQLTELGLLSELQVMQLLDYRQRLGPLIAPEELQAIPSFDLASIYRILPFVRVGRGLDDIQMPLHRMALAGRNELYLRSTRVLEQQAGYRGDEPAYLGNPFRVYARYRHNYENKLSYGITLEKDPGEPWYYPGKIYGFDFISAHFYVRDYSRRLRALAIGDYGVSMGQGLILFSGFGGGKSAFVMNIRRSARTLRPYTSLDENNFFRGGAITLGLTNELEITAFASYRQRDANVVFTALDTLDSEDTRALITSFQLTGFHRTEREIEQKNAIKETLGGAVLRYSRNRFRASANVLYTQFEAPLVRDSRPYNYFRFQNDRLLNASLDYTFMIRNINFFGESAMSDNGGMATVNGMLIGLDKMVDLSLLFRHLGRDFQAMNNNPFTESAQGQNETGLYLGLQITPNRKWQFSAYMDTWKHPWLMFNSSGPSQGSEYLARITYRERRRMEAYIQWRHEVKDWNYRGPDDKINKLGQRQRTYFRIHAGNQISRQVELRSRAEAGRYQLADNQPSLGFLLYQDVILRPIDFPLSVTARFAIFHTDDFNSRLYAFENDILQSFSIPAYYGRGTRYYINLRYRGIRNLVLEARFAQTRRTDVTSIGTGHEATGKPTRTEVKAQAKWSF